MAGPSQGILDLNFRQASARMFSCAERGESLETRDLVITSCGLPIADFNWAFPKLPGADLERAAERAERYFDAEELPFRFVVRADLATGDVVEALVRRGHPQLESRVPGMALDPLRAGPPAPEGLTIRRVDDPATLADFQRTAFVGFGFPAEGGATFLTEGLLESPESALFVGYVDGSPASTAMLVATGPVAGIYWVATIPERRGRGYGEALTWAALEAGLDLGCRVGSLQASQMGRPVYLRMGFEHTADYAHFQRS